MLEMQYELWTEKLFVDDEFELNFHLVNHGMKNRRADMAIQEVFVITVVMALETEDHLVVTVYVENHMVVVHQIVVPGMKTNVEHIQLDTVFIQDLAAVRLHQWHVDVHELHHPDHVPIRQLSNLRARTDTLSTEHNPMMITHKKKTTMSTGIITTASLMSSYIGILTQTFHRIPLSPSQNMFNHLIFLMFFKNNHFVLYLIEATMKNLILVVF